MTTMAAAGAIPAPIMRYSGKRIEAKKRRPIRNAVRGPVFGSRDLALMRPAGARRAADTRAAMATQLPMNTGHPIQKCEPMLTKANRTSTSAPRTPSVMLT